MIISSATIRHPVTDRRTKRQQRDDITSKVLKVSLELFLTNGYRDTTIRQISEGANAKAGSIYNVFHDKEDIVKELVVYFYDIIVSKGQDLMHDMGDLMSSVAFPIAVELSMAHSNRNLAEIMSIAFSSSKVMDRLVGIQEEKTREYYSRFGIQMDSSRTRDVLYAINGVLEGFIIKSMSSDEKDIANELHICMQVYCSLMGIPLLGIEDMARSILATLEDGSVLADVLDTFE